MTKETVVDSIGIRAAEPKVAAVIDSSRIKSINAFIQSDVESILANSIESVNGEYLLSLSEEDADIMGVDGDLFRRYLSLVQQLNSEGK